MTDLQVIWDLRCLVKSKTFPVQQARKAFELWWNKTNTLSCRHGGQIIIRDTKDGYEPSYTSRQAEIWWDKSNYLRAYGEFLRDHKDSINWDEQPTKKGFTIWFMAKDTKDSQLSHFAWDYDNNQKKIFDSLEIAQQYANSQQSIMCQPQIEEIETW